MGDPKHPKSGDLHIDASDVKTVDLSGKQIKKLSKLRDKFKEVLELLFNAPPELLKRIKVQPEEVAVIRARLQNYLNALELFGPTSKLAEMLKETTQHEGHTISSFITETANAVRDRDKREKAGKAIPLEAPEGSSPEVVEAFKKAAEINLLGFFEVLLNYQFEPAERGSETRKKNEEAKKEDPSKEGEA